MFQKNPILYKPKTFDNRELQGLIARNIIKLSFEELNTDISSYTGNLLETFFGVSALAFNTQVYIKPIMNPYSPHKYNWSIKSFGDFEMIVPLCKKCECQIITPQDSWQEHYFFIEHFNSRSNEPCTCGRKISHSHCLLCGGRKDPYRSENYNQEVTPGDDEIIKREIAKLPENEVWCHSCDHKMHIGTAENLFPDIPDLLARLKPGQMIPEGQCGCGGLLYKIRKEDEV